MKIEQAEAKEMRRLEGIEKRKGKQLTLKERIKKGHEDGTSFKRNEEGQDAQRKWDKLHGVIRPTGFYETRHGRKGEFPRGLVGTQTIRIRKVGNV
jgi:hypothetical protein